MHLAILRRGWSESGGAEAYLCRLAEGLSSLGHRITLYGSGEKPERWEHEWVSLPGGSPQEFAAAWALQPRRWDFSLSLERVPGCDFFRAGDGVHAAWMQRRARSAPWWRRVFWHIQPKQRQLLALERQLCAPPSRTKIIANSHLVARELRTFYQVPAERCRVILNGFDPPVRRAEDLAVQRRQLREVWHIHPDEIVALFVGSGWERKGLRAAMAAVERVPGIRLVVAGKGPAHRYRSSQVLHLGPVARVWEIFSGADFLVHPTLYDPFSNACLEAQAAGLPIITTADNGFAELLVENKTGNVLPPGWNVADLVERLRFWQSQVREADGNRRSEACRRAAAPWSVARNVSETLDFLTCGA